MASPFPKTPSDRAVVRRRIRRDVFAEAERRFLQRSRSMKCAGTWSYAVGARHAGDVEGCRNDGSTCICECHDLVGENGAAG